MDLSNTSSENLGIIIGEPGSFKTTLLFHYGYLIIEYLIADKKRKDPDDAIHGVILCNQSKLEQNSFFFGKYSEVFIGHLKQIKLKYIRSYDEMINFLLYFRFIEPKPKFLFIDEPSSFLSDSGDMKLSKLAYLYSLLRDTAKFLPSESEKYFKALVVETIKFKELDNSTKDKENLNVFQKYFPHVLAVRKIDESENKEFMMRKIIYNADGDDKSPFIQAIDYSDSFLEPVMLKINDGLKAT